MSENPYATPEANVVSNGSPDNAEWVRREHINHEASVRSIGLLYYLSCFVLSLAAIALLVGVGDDDDAVTSLAIAVVLLFLAALFGYVGHGLRRLKPSVKTPTIVLSILGLFNFGLGTLINIYVLYLVLSKKGKRIFSDDYQDIVTATPHVKYKTSIVIWIFLGIVLIGIGAAIIIPMVVK